MSAFLGQFIYLGLIVSIGAYWFGEWLKKKTKAAWCNPLLTACVIVAAFLLLTGIDYDTYQQGTKMCIRDRPAGIRTSGHGGAFRKM